jgi:hypothetical protein
VPMESHAHAIRQRGGSLRVVPSNAATPVLERAS